jgi:hypothetical protein
MHYLVVSAALCRPYFPFSLGRIESVSENFHPKDRPAVCGRLVKMRQRVGAS